MKKWIPYSLKKSFLKPGTNKVYWEKIISGFVVWTGLIIFIIYTEGERSKKEALRLSSPRYTIGTVTDYYNGSKGGRTLDFSYYVCSKLYSKGGRGSYEIENRKGARYLVMFYSEDPSNAEILLGYPIPDSVNIVPYGGWKRMPLKSNDDD